MVRLASAACVAPLALAYAASGSPVDHVNMLPVGGLPKMPPLPALPKMPPLPELATPDAFNCDVMYDNGMWKTAWTPNWKDWCCKHKDRGCPSATELKDEQEQAADLVGALMGSSKAVHDLEKQMLKPSGSSKSEGPSKKDDALAKLAAAAKRAKHEAKSDVATKADATTKPDSAARPDSKVVEKVSKPAEDSQPAKQQEKVVDEVKKPIVDEEVSKPKESKDPVQKVAGAKGKAPKAEEPVKAKVVEQKEEAKEKPTKKEEKGKAEKAEEHSKADVAAKAKVVSKTEEVSKADVAAKAKVVSKTEEVSKADDAAKAKVVSKTEEVSKTKEAEGKTVEIAKEDEDAQKLQQKFANPTQPIQRPISSFTSLSVFAGVLAITTALGFSGVRRLRPRATTVDEEMGQDLSSALSPRDGLE